MVSALLTSEETYRTLWLTASIPALSTTSIKLRTYTGEVIPVLGAVTVRIVYGTQVAEAQLLAVEGAGTSLLGRDWLNIIQLNWSEVKFIHQRSAKEV